MQTIRKSLRGEQVRWRIWFWTACEVFVLYSTLCSLHSEIVSDALVCLLVGIGVAVPYILERFGYRMSDTLFVFSLLYLLASMSGRIYKLYYLVAHWDKLLHLCGGVVFALLGSYLPVLINKKYENDRLLRVLFAVLFSIPHCGSFMNSAWIAGSAWICSGTRLFRPFIPMIWATLLV